MRRARQILPVRLRTMSVKSWCVECYFFKSLFDNLDVVFLCVLAPALLNAVA